MRRLGHYLTKRELEEDIGKPLRYDRPFLQWSEKDNQEESENGTIFYVLGIDEDTKEWYAEVTIEDGIITRVE